MADHLRLLLQPIKVETTALDQLIAISAEGMAHQGQIEAATGLGLPDMGHLVDEQSLQREAFVGEVVRPQGAFGMKMDVPGWRHDHAFGLERPPFAADHPDPVVGDGVTEHRSGQRNLAGREGAGSFHKAVIATPKANGNLTCRRPRSPLGQRKI